MQVALEDELVGSVEEKKKARKCITETLEINDIKTVPSVMAMVEIICAIYVNAGIDYDDCRKDLLGMLKQTKTLWEV